MVSNYDHELLSESVLGEKSLVYLRQDERAMRKIQAISLAMAQEEPEKLAALGKSRDGFVNHELRRTAWSQILQIRLPLEVAAGAGVSEDADLAPHKDEHQVALDVKRSFGDVKDPHAKAFLRRALETVIVRVLRRYPRLRYYQGYHDVCSVFVLVFLHTHTPDVNAEVLSMDALSGSSSTDDDDSDGVCSSDGRDNLSSSSISTKLADDSLLFIDSELLFEAVAIFTLLYLRDFMMNSLAFTIDQLRLIPLLVNQKDPQFCRTFLLHEIDPFFALSSILTLFSHDLRPQSDETRDIVFQIFDLVIASNSMLVPLMIYGNLLLAKKDDLLARYNDNIENFDNTTDLIHGVIQQEMIVGSTAQLWNDVLEVTRSSTYDVLPKESKKILNNYSVLLTASHTPTSHEDILMWLSREIKLNEIRSAKVHSVPSDHKTSPITKWQLVARRGGPILIKLSFVVGVAAVLLKLYLQSPEGHRHIVLRPYLEQLKSLKFSGLHQPRKIWLDPLKNLLKMGRS